MTHNNESADTLNAYVEVIPPSNLEDARNKSNDESSLESGSTIVEQDMPNEEDEEEEEDSFVQDESVSLKEILREEDDSCVVPLEILSKSHKQTIVDTKVIYQHEEEASVLKEAMFPMLFSLLGLVLAGWLFDAVQNWEVMAEVTELVILLPVILNLKGNLEMNLSSRLSTSANLGAFNDVASRNAIIRGNLAILHIQAVVFGGFAGIFSAILGLIFHSHSRSWFEFALLLASSSWCAACSGLILGVFMSAVVALSKQLRVNPDNVAIPMAASLGDLLTVIMLVLGSKYLYAAQSTFVSFASVSLLMMSIPLAWWNVKKNVAVAHLLWKGWIPVLAAMIITCSAGLVLEQYIKDYRGLAILVPVLTGLAGSIAAIYASRISTSLYTSTVENHQKTQKDLFLINFPVQVCFLVLIKIFDIGGMTVDIPFIIMYLIVSTILVAMMLLMAKEMTLLFWKWNWDTDCCTLPYLVGIGDVIGTVLVVYGYHCVSQYGS